MLSDQALTKGGWPGSAPSMDNLFPMVGRIISNSFGTYPNRSISPAADRLEPVDAEDQAADSLCQSDRPGPSTKLAACRTDSATIPCPMLDDRPGKCQQVAGTDHLPHQQSQQGHQRQQPSVAASTAFDASQLECDAAVNPTLSITSVSSGTASQQEVPDESAGSSGAIPPEHDAGSLPPTANQCESAARSSEPHAMQQAVHTEQCSALSDLPGVDGSLTLPSSVGPGAPCCCPEMASPGAVPVGKKAQTASAHVTPPALPSFVNQVRLSNAAEDSCQPGETPDHALQPEIRLDNSEAVCGFPVLSSVPCTMLQSDAPAGLLRPEPCRSGHRSADRRKSIVSTASATHPNGSCWKPTLQDHSQTRQENAAIVAADETEACLAGGFPEEPDKTSQTDAEQYPRHDRSESPIGQVLFLQASFFNHSCRPNCYVHRSPSGATVVAMQPIEVGLISLHERS